MADGSQVQFWDRLASSYDERLAFLERRYLQDSRRWIGARVRGQTLEVGVGTGANIAHYPHDTELTALDWSEAMLDVARAKANTAGLRASFGRADIARLGVESESFDTVVSTYLLCSVDDVNVALGEMLRVLRPGGQLLLADHVASSFPPLRLLQHGVDLVTVRSHGEYYTRRPSRVLRRLDVDIVEIERSSLGVIERVRAVKHTA